MTEVGSRKDEESTGYRKGNVGEIKNYTEHQAGNKTTIQLIIIQAGPPDGLNWEKNYLIIFNQNALHDFSF